MQSNLNRFKLCRKLFKMRLALSTMAIMRTKQEPIIRHRAGKMPYGYNSALHSILSVNTYSHRTLREWHCISASSSCTANPTATPIPLPERISTNMVSRNLSKRPADSDREMEYLSVKSQMKGDADALLRHSQHAAATFLYDCACPLSACALMLLVGMRTSILAMATSDARRQSLM